MSSLLVKEAVEQSFLNENGNVKRIIRIGNNTYEGICKSHKNYLPAEKDYFVSSLNQNALYNSTSKNGKLTYIDLFSGGGGLSLGIQESLKLLGFSPKLLAAVDLDDDALKLVSRHFSPFISRSKSVNDIISYTVDHSGLKNDFIDPPFLSDSQIAQFKNKVDLIVGGPPCQGHSNLNNFTRRQDPRNLLYYTLPAFAVALNIPNIIIENVPTITSAKENIVKNTKSILNNHGYHLNELVLNSNDYGVAQSRNRHFLVATKFENSNLKEVVNSLKVKGLTFNDVNIDLPKLSFSNSVIETQGDISEKNHKRINFLHDHDIYDLPNHQRPDCHKNGHSYGAVYGRIFGNEPMGTITTGFGSAGRGRYIHPTERRMISIREGARVQAFPDWYWEPSDSLGLGRTKMFKIIGDAVPSNMVHPIVIGIFDSLLRKRG